MDAVTLGDEYMADRASSFPVHIGLYIATVGSHNCITLLYRRSDQAFVHIRFVLSKAARELGGHKLCFSILCTKHIRWLIYSRNSKLVYVLNSKAEACPKLSQYLRTWQSKLQRKDSLNPCRPTAPSQ